MQVLARACGHSSLADFAFNDLSIFAETMARLTGITWAGGGTR